MAGTEAPKKTEVNHDSLGAAFGRTILYVVVSLIAAVLLMFIGDTVWEQFGRANAGFDFYLSLTVMASIFYYYLDTLRDIDKR